MKHIFLERNCFISKNKLYRWSLSYKISNSKKEIIFIGLNPSLSNSFYVDKTSQKIIKICRNYNYGKVTILNLFALISPNPKKLLTHKKPVGYLNNKIIYENLKYWSKNKHCHLWLGWGNKGIFLNRNKKVSKIIMKFYLLKKEKFEKPLGALFLKKTIQLNPIHPLYCSDKSILQSEE